MTDKLKAIVAFVLAWLSTPTSKAGVITVLTAFLDRWLDATKIEAVYWAIWIGVGVVLILWPQKKHD